MRISVSLAMLAGTVGLTVASPTVASPLSPRFNAPMSLKVGGIGACPADCWNEAAARAGCDPNKSDDCLCGPFFDAVTYCTAATCSAGDNIAALNFLQPAC